MSSSSMLLRLTTHGDGHIGPQLGNDGAEPISQSAMEQSMNAKVSPKFTPNARTKAIGVLKVVGVAAALLVGTSSAFAASFHGAGGHFSGGGHVSAPHFSAPHFAGGGHSFAGAHYSAPGFHAGVGGGFGRAYGGRAFGGVGYGYRPGWGGGYWHGGYWPAAYYGWSYPFFLGVLPAVYATYWWGGLPYYYVNDVYYTYDNSSNGYVATDPPPVSGSYSDDVNAAAAAGADAGDAANSTPPAAPPPAAANIIAYPRNGQSDQQQATDKFQCHTWAKGQTGFDPTSQSSSGAPASVRSTYDRAIAACLDARGYTVR
jgi:hypothetical protein